MIKKKILAILVATIMVFTANVTTVLADCLKQKTNHTCKAAAVAEMINRATGSNYTEGNFYSNSSGSCKSIQDIKYGNFTGEYKTDYSGTSAQTQLNKINDSLSRGVPIVVQVSPGSPHHWVTILRKDGNTYWIADPADGKEKKLNSKYTLGAHGDYGYVCLTGGSANPAPNSNSSKTNTASLTYKAHTQNHGWLDFKNESQTAGIVGNSLRLEALQIVMNSTISGAKIKATGHVSMLGWQPSVEGTNVTIGTTGRSLALEAVKLELLNCPGYSIEYRVHSQNYGWMPWKRDGAIAGTVGEGLRIEGIEIRLVKK